MMYWILVTEATTAGVNQYFVKAYLDISTGRINQPTSGERAH